MNDQDHSKTREILAGGHLVGSLTKGLIVLVKGGGAQNSIPEWVLDVSN